MAYVLMDWSSNKPCGIIEGDATYGEIENAIAKMKNKYHTSYDCFDLEYALGEIGCTLEWITESGCVWW